MATKTIAWATGTGSITISYGGSGSGTATITTSDNNLYEARSQEITLRTTAGSPQVTKKVTITQAARVRTDISAAIVTAANQTYSGSALTPTPTVVLNGTTIPSSGYDVTYSNNTNAGSATITVTGKGDYTGTATGTFTIAKASRTISFTTAPTSVEVGETITVVAAPSAGSGDGTITYSSSNTGKATVSGNVVTGVAEGTVSITATISAGTNYNSATTSYSLNVEPDYSKEYLTIVSLSNNNRIRWKTEVSSYTKTISVSTNGTTWSNKTSTTSGVTLATLGIGGKLYIRGSAAPYATSTSQYNHFVSTGSFDLQGNIMSLIFGSNFVYEITIGATRTYTFARLFINSAIHSAEHLVMPATGLADYCYANMFRNCQSLTKAPKRLPSTALKSYCYVGMFIECGSLVAAPELPAVYLTDNCYGSMFRDCTSLNYIKAMFKSTPGNSYTLNWVQNVKGSGTFVKNSTATWSVTGNNGIPSGWTVETASS